jgi:hypothetical protein
LFNSSIAFAFVRIKSIKRCFVTATLNVCVAATVDKLCAIARFAAFDLQCVRSADRTPTGVERDQVLKRINRYGRSIRFVCDPQLAEAHIEQGLADMVKSVVNTLRLSETSTTVHRLMLMVPRPAGDGDMLVFLSDDIRDRAVRAVADKNASQLLLLANIRDIHDSLRGQIFENRMLDVLEICRTHFSIRDRSPKRQG